MSARAMLSRLAAMDRAELRFRLKGAAQRTAGRLRFSVSPPAWQPRDLVRLLNVQAGPAVGDARSAAERGEFLEAHRLLARHFETRARRWPLSAANRTALSAALRQHFPSAATDAHDRAASIVDGRFDLLGYCDLFLGNPPDWHADAVHRRRAPRGFWADVPFLDPVVGDHKVIWEVNRHQHFMILGAAYWLTETPTYRHTFIEHLRDWLRANPPLDGINWASMLELAFRTLSWTWAVEFFCANAEADDSPWLVELLVALDRQLVHIEQNLSTYFSPNTHISGEALALYAVSLAFPELRSSPARVALGREILLREARAQVRDDGGHAELSSHYHRYSTDFHLLALLVARLTGDSATPVLARLVRAQAEYLRTIADDRGRLPGIGDEDGGQLFEFGGASPSDASASLSALAVALADPGLGVAAPTPEAYWISGERPDAAAATNAPVEWPSRHLRESGYFVSRSNRGHLIFDAGPHGFLNGGHAHADALSIVLTVDGIPLLVDPGTATYTMERALRDRFRSAAMHNTVTIDGHGFAEPRGSFHWARTTDARMLVARAGADGDFAVGAHAGHGFMHTRAVLVLPARGWLIVDGVAPRERVRMEASWHLHPSWTAEVVDDGFALRHDSGVRTVLTSTATDRRADASSSYSLEYGRVERATVLRTAASASGPTLLATFIPQPALVARAHRLAVEGKTDTNDGWTRWRLACRWGPDEARVTVALPRNPDAPPANWPQPCIQELRLSCVE